MFPNTTVASSYTFLSLTDVPQLVADGQSILVFGVYLCNTQGVGSTKSFDLYERDGTTAIMLVDIRNIASSDLCKFFEANNGLSISCDAASIGFSFATVYYSLMS